MRTLLVTGAAGFLGFNFVRRVLADEPAARVVGLDKLSYAGHPRSLALLDGEPRFRFVRGDVADRALVRALLAEERPAALVHFAAETHVDRSIAGADDFIHSNVVGTYGLLEEVRRAAPPAGFRFVHVSTDEVWGALGPTGRFTEDSPYRPSSPYAASKAASDHLVRAYHRTHGVPVVTTNGCNSYGPFQFPEKLVPVTIAAALAGRPLPIYGRGANVRDWLYVDDHCRAVAAALARGRPGEAYAVGAGCERTNLELVREICAALDELAPRPGGARHEERIAFVADRPGHDLRYAVDAAKIERELGWRPQVALADGLRRTIAWYMANPGWIAEALARV